MAKEDKVTKAEVKAAAKEAGVSPPAKIGQMSQADRASFISGLSPTQQVAAQTQAPQTQTPTNRYGGQYATAQYMDAPAQFTGGLAALNEKTPIVGQFENRAGKDFYIGADGNVYKTTKGGSGFKEVKKFEFGAPTTQFQPATEETAAVPYGWTDYAVERRNDKLAKYPTSTVKMYNPITGQVEEVEEEEEEKLLPPTGGPAPTTGPSAPGTQYGVTDQLPWLTGPNTGIGGRQSLNLMAPGHGDYSLPSGNKLFNIDWGSDPFSGRNWGDTMMAKTGQDLGSLYSGFMDAAKSGNFSLSSLSREMGMNPGDIHEMYKRLVQYATQNGLPIPSLPEFSAQTAPYYTYGFGPGKQQVGYEIPGQAAVVDDPATTDVDETKAATAPQWTVNPLGYWMGELGQLRENESTAPPAVAPPQYGTKTFAKGGQVAGGLGGIQKDPVIHRYLRGGSGGQDDKIPAMLSDGEYVFDADAVAALGDGNNEAGARKLDKMRENLRRHKRSAPANKIPPKAKAPEQYLRKGK